MATRIQCDLCPSTLRTKKGFKVHNGTHHENRKVYFCKMDLQYFTDQSQLEKHLMESHKVKSIVKCCFCDKSFTNLKCRKYHILKLHSNESKVTCQICSKAYSSPFNLKVHVRNIHNKIIQKEGYKCEQCGKRFPDETRFKIHTKNSHLKKYNCDKCGDIFDTQKRLKHHIAIEHRLARYKQYANHDVFNCKMCNTSKTELNFKCELCDEKFQKQSHLFEHIKLHLEESSIKEENIIAHYYDSTEVQNPVVEKMPSITTIESEKYQIENVGLQDKISELNNIVELLKRDLEAAKEENVKLSWENQRFRKFCKCD